MNKFRLEKVNFVHNFYPRPLMVAVVSSLGLGRMRLKDELMSFSLVPSDEWLL
jgi:hypothetical protein